MEQDPQQYDDITAELKSELSLQTDEEPIKAGVILM